MPVAGYGILADLEFLTMIRSWLDR